MDKCNAKGGIKIFHVNQSIRDMKSRFNCKWCFLNVYDLHQILFTPEKNSTVCSYCVQFYLVMVFLPDEVVVGIFTIAHLGRSMFYQIYWGWVSKKTFAQIYEFFLHQVRVKCCPMLLPFGIWGNYSGIWCKYSGVQVCTNVMVTTPSLFSSRT